jgi:hypothetical protein
MESRLQALASTYVKQYTTEAHFFVEQMDSGQRQLVVRYDPERYSGRKDLPKADDGRYEFSAAIPDDWSPRDIDHLLLWPMKHPNAPYPPGRSRRGCTAVRHCSGSGVGSRRARRIALAIGRVQRGARPSSAAVASASQLADSRPYGH